MPIKQAKVQAGLIFKVFQDSVSNQQTMRETESKIEIKLKEIEIKLKDLELKIEKVKGALNT